MFRFGLLNYRRHLIPVDFVIDTLAILRADGMLPTETGGAPHLLDLLRFHRLLGEAARRNGGPAYGLCLARKLSPTLFSRLGHMMLCADNLLTAAKTIAQQSDGIGMVMRLLVVEDARYFRLVFDHRVGLPFRPLLVSELALGMFWIWIQRMAPVPQDHVQVRISHAMLGKWKPYLDFFGTNCEIVFDAEQDSMTFSRADFTRCNPARDPTLFFAVNQLLEKESNHQLADFKRQLGQDWLSRIRSTVLAQLNLGNCNIEAVASRLCLTPRTLQRKLGAYDVTFSTLQDECRREMAWQLTQQGMAPASIAARIGFSSPVSLRRAFMRWFGVAPGKLLAGFCCDTYSTSSVVWLQNFLVLLVLLVLLVPQGDNQEHCSLALVISTGCG